MSEYENCGGLETTTKEREISEYVDFVGFMGELYGNGRADCAGVWNWTTVSLGHTVLEGLPKDTHNLPKTVEFKVFWLFHHTTGKVVYDMDCLTNFAPHELCLKGGVPLPWQHADYARFVWPLVIINNHSSAVVSQFYQSLKCW